MIPGSNILNSALSVINSTAVLYFKAAGRALNAVGQYVSVYEPAVTLKTSFQPVPREVYQQYGLDYQKNYFRLFASQDIIDIDRDVSADKVEFNGATYLCESATEWYMIDGWVEILCVKIND